MRTVLLALTVMLTACEGGFEVEPDGPIIPPVEPGTPGGGGGGGGGGEPASSFRVALATSDAEITLDDVSLMEVTVSSQNFEGEIALAVQGLPDDWEATFAVPTIQLAKDQEVSTSLTIKPPMNAGGDTVDVLVVGSHSSGNGSSSPVQVEVLTEYVFYMGSHDYPTDVVLPVGHTLHFFNDDAVGHLVHAGNPGQGFDHQRTGERGSPTEFDPMEQGERYTVTPNRAARYGFYCHTHQRQSDEVSFTLVDQ